jgi:PEGA domain-containing protein
MSALTVTATQPAEVFIDGERVGETPLTSRPINLGTRDVVVKSASGGERKFTITVTVDPVRIDVDFSTP